MTVETLTDAELETVIGGLSTPRVGDDAYRTIKDLANGGCGCGGTH